MELHDLCGMKMQQHTAANQLCRGEQDRFPIDAASFRKIEVDDRQPAAGCLQENAPDRQRQEERR